MSLFNNYEELFYNLDDARIERLNEIERLSFSPNASIKDKVMSELINIQYYLIDSMSNEALFDNEYLTYVNNTIDIIRSFIVEEEYEQAAYAIVKLKLQLNLEIGLTNTLVDIIQSGITYDSIMSNKGKGRKK